MDDEKPAREELITLLQHYHDIEILAVCKNAFEARTEIERLKPDVLFLDIAMPQKSGFDLLAELSLVPQVIFVTAHDEFAIKAFEENALDYLLKPVTEDRLRKTIDRLRQLANHANTPRPLGQQFFVRDRGDFHLVKFDEIILIESYGNYIRIFVRHNRQWLHPRTLKETMRFLPGDTFARINHRQIINLKFVEHFTQTSSRQLKIVLKDRAEPLWASTRKAPEIRSLLTSKP